MSTELAKFVHCTHFTRSLAIWIVYISEQISFVENEIIFFLLLLLSNLTGKISSYRLHANLISTTEKRLFRNVVKENENHLHAKFVSVIFLPHNQFASIILFFCRENEMLNLLCINRRWKNKLKNCSDKPYSVMFFLFFFHNVIKGVFINII